MEEQTSARVIPICGIGNTNICAVGVSVAGGNMQLLERLTIAPEERPERLGKLQAELGVAELLYLATCNRVEFIVATTEDLPATEVRNRILDHFFRAGRDIQFQPSDLQAVNGAAALRHVFRVVSALESIVIGETQITGQFKNALQEGIDLGIVGLHLEPFAFEALQVARQVRNQTDLGRGAVSMASLVMDELESKGVLSSATRVALVGSGEMTVKVATYLKKFEVSDILFVNRTASKAQALAERFCGRAVFLEDFLSAPPELDVIVSATSAPAPLFDSMFHYRLSSSGNKVCCVDLAIPRDFGEVFDESRKADLIDISHLQDRKDTNLHQKFREMDKAGEIVERAVNHFQRSQIEKTIRPALKESYYRSMEFALGSCGKLMETHLADYPNDIGGHIEKLIRKVVGYSSAQFGHAVSEHLCQGLGERELTEMCEEAKRDCFPDEQFEQVGRTEPADKAEPVECSICPVKKTAHA